jgi:hypothetical protein
MIHYCEFNRLPHVILLEIKKYLLFQDYCSLLNTNKELCLNRKYLMICFHVNIDIYELHTKLHSILQLRSKLKNCFKQFCLTLGGNFKNDNELNGSWRDEDFTVLKISDKSICLDLLSPAKSIRISVSGIKLITCENFQ